MSTLLSHASCVRKRTWMVEVIAIRKRKFEVLW